ncbi:cysteine-rich repeat secretory protein 1-like [Beta vulgaris subsp. vulgaris]|uniref:cysteine-rich repeat secretory protein 1-like n=1 Tax=Beta vulgaris subsp. vulgaris TaxID=3555 RepID=UPI002548AF4A|nr:cysteine-rich repeat secretory protein 1-like [Beta vulgaris subsp. vulgaris]
MNRSSKILNSFLQKFKLPLLFISSYFFLANAQLTYIQQYCYNDFGTYSVLSNYSSNIVTSINELASKASTTYYNNYTTGIGEDQVNAFYSCRYDIPLSVCQSCVASAANNVSWCISSVESLIAYEECTLHYSNRSIFSVMEELPTLYHLSSYMDNLVTGLIFDVGREFFTSSRYFATTKVTYSSSENIYALAQCNPDITSFECKTCLEFGYQNFTRNYTGRVYGQIFMPSCRLSYILSSEEPSPPWRFAETFDQIRHQVRKRRFSPRVDFTSTGTRGSPIIYAIIVSICTVALSLKLLF